MCSLGSFTFLKGLTPGVTSSMRQVLKGHFPILCLLSLQFSWFRNTIIVSKTAISTMGFPSFCCGYKDSTFSEDSRVSELSNQAVMVLVSIVMMVM